MEVNRFGIEKYDGRYDIVDFNNSIFTHQHNNNFTVTHRFIKGNRFGISIEKIYGSK